MTRTTITYRSEDGTETEREVPDWDGGHDVEWTVSSGYIRGEFTCTAAVGAFCRLSCAEECGAEEWPCYSFEGANENLQQRQHALVDCGHCHAVVFLENESAEETYAGLGATAVSGAIVIHWNGLGYMWRYPEASGE